MDIESESNVVIPKKMTRNLPNILVTGTPGVGKTTFCKLLKGYLEGIEYIAVANIVMEKKLYKEIN